MPENTTDFTSIRAALLDRIRSERAERHEQQVDVYYPDPSFEFMADLVHWKMEKTAETNGSIKSITAGLEAIQSTLNNNHVLTVDPNVDICTTLATIAALAIRTAIDLGMCDDAVISNWDEVIDAQPT